MCIERAEGGVLFVDEAYRLKVDSEKDYGKEALDTLMEAMLRGNPVMIFAGYPAQMEELMKLNPGFKRRIRAIFTFDDFTCEELAEIFMRKLHFHAEASCLQTEIMLSLIRRKLQQTDFLKVISNPHITLSSFLELKR